MSEVDHKTLGGQLDVLLDQFERGTIASDQYHRLRNRTVEAWINNWQTQNDVKKSDTFSMALGMCLITAFVLIIGSIAGYVMIDMDLISCLR